MRKNRHFMYIEEREISGLNRGAYGRNRGNSAEVYLDPSFCGLADLGIEPTLVEPFPGKLARATQTKERGSGVNEGIGRNLPD